MNALYIICGLGMISLLAEIFNFKQWLFGIVMIGLALAVLFSFIDIGISLPVFENMLVFDRLANGFTILITATAFGWFWMSRNYFAKDSHLTDRFVLVLFAVAGAIILTAIANMAMLFLGIEIMSIAVYVLAGSKKRNLFSTEAAFKYFLMGSFATGFLLMGIVLIYGATGTFELSRITLFVSTHPADLPSFLYTGVLLVLVGMCFKISVVPFHFWAPDVYDGSPTSITAFMSTIVKTAAFASVLKLFLGCFSELSATWIIVLLGISALTLVVANVTAVYQTNVKRLLAYSSVGHAGYILLAVVSNGNVEGAVLYYLAGYSIASLLAFSVMTVIEEKNHSLTIDSFNGLFVKKPMLALAMTIALLSLAGIPPLPGFFGKYLVLSLAVGSGHLWLVIIAIGTSVIGVYYYFKIILAMYFKKGSDELFALGGYQKLLFIVLLLLIFVAGIFPDLFQF